MLNIRNLKVIKILSVYKFSLNEDDLYIFGVQNEKIHSLYLAIYHAQRSSHYLQLDCFELYTEVNKERAFIPRIILSSSLMILCEKIITLTSRL